MASMFTLNNFVLATGAVALAKCLVLPVLSIIIQIVRPAKDLKKYGEWTVITGATDGIGRDMALELAKKGQNLIIVGRNATKLADVTKEITTKYSSCEVESVQADLSEYDQDAINALQAAITNKNVGILVNNAGLSYEFVQYFHEVDADRVGDIVEVNTYAPTLISHLIVKECFFPKKKGAIVNISSGGSIIPHQLHAVYSASKSFLNKFSDDLRREYSYLDVSVQIPFFVATKMSKIKRGSLTVPTPAQYAASAVKQIGYEGLIAPYPVHAVMMLVLNLLPDVILNTYIDYLHKLIRKRGMRRRQNGSVSSPKS